MPMVCSKQSRKKVNGALFCQSLSIEAFKAREVRMCLYRRVSIRPIKRLLGLDSQTYAVVLATNALQTTAPIFMQPRQQAFFLCFASYGIIDYNGIILIANSHAFLIIFILNTKSDWLRCKSFALQGTNIVREQTLRKRSGNVFIRMQLRCSYLQLQELNSALYALVFRFLFGFWSAAL